MDLEQGFRLGPWAVVPNQSLLRTDAIERHVEPRIMAVLMCLARHAPDTATRDQLFTEVWGPVVVQDEALSRNISVLRSSLALDDIDHQFIQTIPRIGYRLLELPTVLITPETELLPRRLTHWRPWASLAGVTVSVILLMVFIDVIPEVPVPDVSPPAATNAAALNQQMLKAGYASAGRRGADYLHRSIRLFTDTLSRDPHALEARLGLASSLALLPSYEDTDSELAFTRALAELQLFVEDGGASQRTHATAAFIQLHRLNLTEAELRFRDALAADPLDSGVHQWYSQLLGQVGRLRDAADHAETARNLDPNSPVNQHRLGVTHLWAGRDDDAAAQFELATQAGMAPFINPEPKVILYFRQSRYDELIALLSVVQKTALKQSLWVADLRDALANQTAKTRRIALRSVEHAWLAGDIDARLYFGIPLFLGDANAALRSAIAISRAGQSTTILEGFFLPEARSLRALPEFVTLTRELGLVPYWTRFGPPDVCRMKTTEIRFCLGIAAPGLPGEV